MQIAAFSAAIGLYVPAAAVAAIALMVVLRNTAAYDSLLGIFLLLEIAHKERGMFLFHTVLVILVLCLSFSVFQRHQAAKFPF